MLFSGWWLWERCADGKFERCKCVIRCAEGIDVLAFGREQRPLGVEQIERGRTAQTVADRGDAKHFAGLRQKVVADEYRLPQRGRGVRVCGLDVQTDLRADVALTLEPRQRALVPTGLAVAIPPGFEGQVRPRSGLASPTRRRWRRC